MNATLFFCSGGSLGLAAVGGRAEGSSTFMIAIIDYGMGNLGSVAKAFAAIGAEIMVTSRPDDLDRAEKIVLPGVGAFQDTMLSLKKMKIIPTLVKNIKNGKPYLGLCLGMQILFEESSEGGRHEGLGILKGKVKRFHFTKDALKVPHMGWNTIVSRPSSLVLRPKILQGIPDGAWMYFVHSYYVAPKDNSVIAATTDYGIRFASAIWKDNIYATQFHPEKSQELGIKMLENFVRL